MRGILLPLLLALSFFVKAAEGPATNNLRVMTYNIHHGQGADGKIDLERIAAIIKTQQVDIVALQEVDSGTLRVTRRDLPAELSKLTGLNACFGKNIEYQGGGYGTAVLSRFPILEMTNLHYQMMHPHEQRGLLQAVLDLGGRKILLLNTHLDYHNDDAERVQDVKAIKAAIDSRTNMPVILCGDFNEGPGSRTHNRLSEFLADTWKEIGNGSGFTFSSSAPWQRIDFIWHSRHLRALKTAVIKTNASDHLPVVAEFSLE
ncbi:MAG TPA: endonuclease/exonuclease/phosphatase family protein [Verrucomicrobiae bacterium]|nr:endonuclease/exonuclease/phosphatase family protein [Verrucomicrobiae bacterium]